MCPRPMYSSKTNNVPLYFLVPIAGLLARELAVAEIFGFSFFGFFVSFLLFLPLAIVCPFKLQLSDSKITWISTAIHRLLD